MSDFDAGFRPISIAVCEVDQSPRYGALMEVTPWTDLPAPLMWRHLFHNSCDASPDIEWFGAGFARCSPDEVDRVKSRLADIAQSVNAAYLTHISEATPEEQVRLEVEALETLTKGDADGYPIWI